MHSVCRISLDLGAWSKSTAGALTELPHWPPGTPPCTHIQLDTERPKCSTVQQLRSSKQSSKP